MKIACEITGVGVYLSWVAMMISTPLAANTSSALATAGSDRTCVSMPTNSGPLMQCGLRYRHIALTVASTGHSLKLFCSAEPRWPDVPNETRCAVIEQSDTPV